MKKKSWVYLIGGLAWQTQVLADEALDAYRLGYFHQASSLFEQQTPQTGDGLFALGEIYLYGYGLPRDKTKALEAYTQAAQKNNLAAINVLARYELLVQHQPEQALQWFKKAADLGDVSAMLYTAAAYIYGIGSSTNPDMAKKYYINAAKLGNPLAQMTLAEHFFDAKSGKNTTLAWLWLNKACGQNYAPALLMKAKLLHQGQHGPANVEEAQTLLTKVKSMHYLPALVVEGDWAAASGNANAAVASYTQAVDLGYEPAMLALSNLYAKADGPLYNQDLSLEWLLKAARREDLTAQKQLIGYYEKMQNVSKAQEWKDYIKKSPKTRALQQQKLAAFWLSAGQYQDFMHGDYVLKGIWFDWHNPKALQEHHLNAAPKFLALGPKQLFMPNYQMIKPQQISFMEYLDAILRVKGDLPQPDSLMPHYGLPNQGQLTQEQVKNLEYQAHLGVAEAQFVVGQCYLHGIQVAANLNTARYWFEKAKAMDELRAQYELSLLDLKSSDPSLQKQGLGLLKDAAYKGNPHAEYTYGLLQEFGYGQLVKNNLEEAKDMFRLASLNGLGMAKFRLAEWLSREPLSTLPVQERQSKQLVIKQLYQDAVKMGIQQAKLPLAFIMAASNDPKQRDWALQTAKEYAKNDNQEASLLAGLLIANNQANPNRLDDAMPWFKQAQAHPIGGFVWASLHPEADTTEAYLTKAADAKFSYALLNRAVYAKEHQKPSEADLQQAVDMGNFSASHLLANQLMVKADANSMAKAREIYVGLAKKGDVVAQTKLSYLLIYGLGGEKNPELGQQWLNLAAQQHYPLAEFVMGMSAHMGYLPAGVDDNSAKYWFKQASAKMPMASVNLGFIYETVDKNYRQALAAYQQALPKFKLGSSYNLGLIYQYGKGLPMDIHKAEEHYQEAAAEGSSKAMLALGNMLLQQDQTKALQWYQKAAAHGQTDAWYRMGMMYEAGLGGDSDVMRAQDAYQKAAKAGDARAQNALNRLQQQVNVQAPAKVSMVRQFLAKHWYAAGEKTGNISPELEYLGVLDHLNQGQLPIAQQSLQQLMQHHPYYAPAQQMMLQLKSVSAR